MVHQQRSRPADPHTTITPTATDTDTDTVTGGLYEAGFSTTGRHPRAGIALVRTRHRGPAAVRGHAHYGLVGRRL